MAGFQLPDGGTGGGRRKGKISRGGGSLAEGGWTMSTWPGETARVWETQLGRQPGQQLEKKIRGDTSVMVKAKYNNVVSSFICKLVKG
jgi:hypothetical protein